MPTQLLLTHAYGRRRRSNALADNGEAEILAIVHNTGLDSGIGAVAALNAYYGRGRRQVRLGAFKGAWDSDMRGWPGRAYVDDLVNHSDAAVKNYTQVITHYDSRCVPFLPRRNRLPLAPRSPTSCRCLPPGR